MKPKTYFITGVSGAGKSTLVDFLKKDVDFAYIHDFDEKGVPDNPDVAWRLETTDMWLEKAKEYASKGKSTVICRVSVPSEVRNSKYSKGLDLRFGFLYIPKEAIVSRLKKRDWSEKEIENNINWAKALLSYVKEEPHSFIVDSYKNNPEIVAKNFISWMNNE